MKLAAAQLALFLKQNSPRTFLLSGDDTFLLQEACKTIYSYAQKLEFNSRELFHVEPGFNWEDFLSVATNYSLFNDNTILELRLNSKINETGSQALLRYLAAPSADKILIIITSKLDAAIQKTNWFKALDAAGLVVQIWPLDAKQLPNWIQQHLAELELKTDAAGIRLLVDHSAGNLLAAAQEIEKLRLIYGPKFLTADEIIAVITDNSKYNVFNLVDNMLLPNKAHILKILSNLKNENTEPTLVLWAIVRELRTLIELARAITTGKSVDTVLQEQHIWSNRKATVKKVLTTHTQEQLQQLLLKVTQLDLIIKGVSSGNFWIELEQILMHKFEKLERL